MKLELKHLAPYLPYGLKVFVEDGINAVEEVLGMWQHSCITEVEDTDFELLKPILRPLSDLTKEIEHNGEKFVPIQKISFVDGEFYLDEVDDIIYFNDTCGLDAYEVTRCYSLIEKLFEWHFDVFDLLSKNLAIDKNTLDQ